MNMYKERKGLFSFIIEKVLPLLSYIIFIAILSFTWYLEQDKVENHVFIRSEDFFKTLFTPRLLMMQRIIVFTICIIGIININNERNKKKKMMFGNNRRKVAIIYNIFMVMSAFFSLILLFIIAYIKSTTIFVITSASIVMLIIEVVRVVFTKW